MAINFPSGPSVNQIFSDPTSGFTYQWNGTVWVNYNYTAPAKIQELDDISGSFNSSTQTFALTVSSSAVSPVKADQLIINIGGVAQNPGVDYTISGSDITFTTAPDAGLDFYGVLLGGSTNLTEAATGTVRPDSLSSGAPSWNTSGDLLVTGVTTIANTGTASTALTVLGGARITGILTVGSSSITINGTNNEITVGTGATLSSSGITVGIITGTFYGDGIGLDNVGVGTTGSINTSGIITASSFHGDGSGLINLGGPLEPLTYSPGIGETNVGLTTNIVLTFGKPIKANTGTITLRTDSASGTIIESFDVGTSSSISINGGELTINPTDDFVGLTTYFVVFPAAAYKDTFESSSSVGITTYSFTTQQLIDVLFVWGDNTASNSLGALGLNDVAARSSPTQLPGTQWSDIAVGYQNSGGIKSDGTLWMWGDGGYGKPAQNNRTNYSSPIQVPGTQWSMVSLGQYQCGSIKDDGTLWMWGSGNSGQLGQNDQVVRSSPVQVPGTQWRTINCSLNGTYATKTDGTLWAWGNNSHGALAQNDAPATQHSSPRQIPGTQWGQVAAGNLGAIAFKTDGTAWGWGQNTTGALGLNDVAPRSSPVQIPGTQWSWFSWTYASTYGIKTDGTLWSCGYNSNGKLGLNTATTDRRSSPVQVPGTQWVRSGGSLRHAVLATKSDGTLWSWGRNQYGALGQNDVINRSSPVQIPGTDWNYEFIFGKNESLNFGSLAYQTATLKRVSS